MLNMNGIYNKKRIVADYLENEILNGNHEYVCHIYPLFRLKTSLFQLWKSLFVKHNDDENKTATLIEFIKIITQEKYINLMDDKFKELVEILKDIRQCDDIINEITNIAIKNDNMRNINHNLLNIQTNKNHFIDGIFIIEPKILAHELTYICSQLCHNITIIDFLKIGINYKYKGNSDISKLIKLSDTLSFTISHEIIMSNDIKYQEFLILYFIKTAFILKKINNFHMLFSVCAGLNHPKVQNIKELWNGKKYIQKFNELVDIIKFDRNYKNYRTLLNKQMNVGNKNMGIIPYIGVILLDINNICEIDIVNKADNSINVNILHDINEYLNAISMMRNNYNYVSNSYAFNRIARMVNVTNIVDLYDLESDNKIRRRLSEPDNPIKYVKNKNYLILYSKKIRSVQYFTQ